MAKTQTISRAAELQRLFVQLFQNEPSKGYSLRVSAPEGARAEVRLEGPSGKFNLPVQPILYPSRYLLSDRQKSPNSILLSAHIPEALSADFRGAGISHADLNGLLFIAVPGFTLDRRLYTRQYRNPGSQLDVFTGKTSRIVRALLAKRERDWTQEQLTEHTGVSRGLVSRALNALAEGGSVKRMVVQTRFSPAQYRLVDFDQLLDEWKAKDRWRDRVTIQQVSLLTNDVMEIARMVRDSLGAEQVAFTQWFAAHLRHPYATPPLVSAYVKSRRLLDVPVGRKVTTGGNLWLLLPEDEGIFLETQDVAGFPLLLDIQIYLDLLQVSQRGPEQAEALRNWEGFGL